MQTILIKCPFKGTVKLWKLFGMILQVELASGVSDLSKQFLPRLMPLWTHFRGVTHLVNKFLPGIRPSKLICFVLDSSEQIFTGSETLLSKFSLGLIPVIKFLQGIIRLEFECLRRFNIELKINFGYDSGVLMELICEKTQGLKTSWYCPFERPIGEHHNSLFLRSKQWIFLLSEKKELCAHLMLNV